MNAEVVISVKNVSMIYQTYDQHRTPLKNLWHQLTSQKVFEKEDKSHQQKFTALANLTLDIQQGETVGIIGRNGSGKSTLLQLITGILNPTSGVVQTKGKISALLELGSGFNPEFTGRENIFLNGKILGLSQQQIKDRYEAILSFADIGNFIDSPVKTYSSGMTMRLAFSVVAHVDADILIIDEALSVGDAFFVQKCMRFLRAFMEKGTVLFVSHDTGAVRNLCTKVIWLENGQIHRIGDPKTIVDEYAISVYSTQQDTSSAKTRINKKEEKFAEVQLDCRQHLINSSTIRNDITAFLFNEAAERWGAGGVHILDIKITDADHKNIHVIIGGEKINIVIVSSFDKEITNIIVGFILRDRLGQALFGDNTFLHYLDNPISAEPHEKLNATFSFVMPALPKGMYSLTVAVASGTQENHVIHVWINDAMLLESHNPSVVQGLVGIPMHDISINKILASQ